VAASDKNNLAQDICFCKEKQKHSLARKSHFYVKTEQIRHISTQFAKKRQNKFSKDFPMPTFWLTERRENTKMKGRKVRNSSNGETL